MKQTKVKKRTKNQQKKHTRRNTRRNKMSKTEKLHKSHRSGRGIMTQITLDHDDNKLKISYNSDEDLENTINILASHMYNKMNREQRILFLLELRGFGNN